MLKLTPIPHGDQEFTRDDTIDWQLLDSIVFDGDGEDIDYHNGVQLYQDLPLEAMKQLIEHGFVDPASAINPLHEEITLDALLNLVESLKMEDITITFTGTIQQSNPKQPVNIDWMHIAREDDIISDEEITMLHDSDINIPSLYISSKREYVGLRLWS